MAPSDVHNIMNIIYNKKGDDHHLIVVVVKKASTYALLVCISNSLIIMLLLLFPSLYLCTCITHIHYYTTTIYRYYFDFPITFLFCCGSNFTHGLL